MCIRDSGGAPLTRRAVEIVRRVHTCSGGTYPIIGVGGLMSADDVRAMLDAGADLVQLYTGYVYNGPGMVKEVCRALIADAEARQAAEKAARQAAASEAAEPKTDVSAVSAPDTEAPEAAEPTSPADAPQTQQEPAEKQESIRS